MMMRTRPAGFAAIGFGVLLLATAVSRCAAAQEADPRRLERSFRLHVSLANLPRLSEWSDNFPRVTLPQEAEIRHAAHLLTEDYTANRLYLVYQKEVSLSDAEHLFVRWRAACPPDVEIVPTLVLHAGRDQGALFSPAEIKSLQAFFKTEVNSNRLGIIASRQSDPILPALASHCELLNLDLTLGEKLAGPFSGGVENIDAALSDGQTAEEWRQKGLMKLRSSLQAHAQDGGAKRVFSLSAAASPARDATGVRDPEKEAASPSRRNIQAMTEILAGAPTRSTGGFSVDLSALQMDSRAVSHDGSGYAFYEMLKRGHIYVGFYARPFHEIVSVYDCLQAGKLPSASN